MRNNRLGHSPALLQRSYLVDPEAVDLAARRVPSTAMASELCAGIAATEALKILFGRGEVLSAPWGVDFDAYRNRARRTRRPGGNRNPVQRIAIGVARRQLAAMRRRSSIRYPMKKAPIARGLLQQEVNPSCFSVAAAACSDAQTESSQAEQRQGTGLGNALKDCVS